MKYTCFFVSRQLSFRETNVKRDKQCTASIVIFIIWHPFSFFGNTRSWPRDLVPNNLNFVAVEMNQVHSETGEGVCQCYRDIGVQIITASLKHGMSGKTVITALHMTNVLSFQRGTPILGPYLGLVNPAWFFKTCVFRCW